MAKAENLKGKRKKKLRILPLSRPATPQDIIDRARQYGPACIRALADEVANNVGAPRIMAADKLLERGYGKVGQPLKITGADGGAVVFRWAEDSDSHE
ncbi:MAG: hypothetical protein LBQ10_12060 [Desulfovibrio sp.]|jgi:hypothetical protein|nr:hypothetical protein [Desulfovibrio sp.]